MNKKSRIIFKGKVVNKAHTIDTGVDEFPRYVVEYLIDNYCSEETFYQDLEKVVKRLKDRGLTSPYLRTFVVARINPLRWIKGEPPPLEEVLKTMRERAAKFNTEKIKQEDLASMAGAPGEED